MIFMGIIFFSKMLGSKFYNPVNFLSEGMEGLILGVGCWVAVIACLPFGILYDFSDQLIHGFGRW